MIKKKIQDFDFFFFLFEKRKNGQSVSWKRQEKKSFLYVMASKT